MFWNVYIFKDLRFIWKNIIGERIIMGDKLDSFFESYLNKESLFKDKSVLISSYMPDIVQHRDEQIDQVANILAPALRVERPSNLFIYGKTGTGKTLSVRYTAKKIQKVAQEKGIPVESIYVNCKLKRVADTEYRLIAYLAKLFGMSEKEIPPTGLPTDEIYNRFFKHIEKKKKVIILILDEIDQLIRKAGDDVIYNLTRINSELKNAQICFIGISNDLIFVDNLDPRIKSSLSQEEIVFPPYNALQLQSILKHRCSFSFVDDVLGEGVIAKCSAYAAREHGDARRALELLRVAGELAERESSEQVKIKHIDKAEDKIEKDRMIDMVKTQPKQFQAVLYVVLQLCKKQKKNIYTGDVYNQYRKLSSMINLRPLTQRRVSDIIAELDMLGIINAKNISKGRYGRTRDISVSLSSTIEPKVMKILEEDLDI